MSTPDAHNALLATMTAVAHTWYPIIAWLVYGIELLETVLHGHRKKDERIEERPPVIQSGILSSLPGLPSALVVGTLLAGIAAYNMLTGNADEAHVAGFEVDDRYDTGADTADIVTEAWLDRMGKFHIERRSAISGALVMRYSGAYRSGVDMTLYAETEVNGYRARITGSLINLHFAGWLKSTTNGAPIGVNFDFAPIRTPE